MTIEDQDVFGCVPGISNVNHGAVIFTSMVVKDLYFEWVSVMMELDVLFDGK